MTVLVLVLRWFGFFGFLVRRGLGLRISLRSLWFFGRFAALCRCGSGLRLIKGTLGLFFGKQKKRKTGYNDSAYTSNWVSEHGSVATSGVDFAAG